MPYPLFLLLAALVAVTANATGQLDDKVIDRKPQSRDIQVQGRQMLDD